MKSSYYNLIIILLIAATSSSSFSSSSSTASSWTDLVDRTCKLTPFYDLCISTLLNDPQSPSADTHGLAAIIASDLLQSANNTLSSIQEMISRSPPDPESEQPLAYCAEVYIPIVKYSLPQSIEALEKGRYGFAVYGIADAEKGVQACEKRVEGAGGLDAVKSWNEAVREMADVALSIIKVLQGN
ncbi:hypothetical protein MLD38_020584 [Melastoma candidum]|uniref:Uncharacterized protein n=1 Tax=Melastoma candidum TaxID=119954 RepID=A0ACB9QEB9_9MYRT|nr:hypothetical protein MLD38_020584 [Melastoma candidum]